MDPPVSASPGLLAEVVQRERALFEEVCAQGAGLHGVAVKLLDDHGNRLVEVPGEVGLCQYVYELPACRQACRAIVGGVRQELPAPRGLDRHVCFSGAEYRVAPVHHETSVIGKLVLGPFLPPAVQGVPSAFTELDPAVDPAVAWERTDRFARLDPALADRLARALATGVEVLAFSSLKSRMTTDMHVESIREAYAELAEKHDVLEETARALEHTNRNRTRVLTTLGRRLSAPLTNIIAHAEMLAQGVLGEISEDQHAFLETIIDSAETLVALSTALDELSVVERGQLALEAALVDVKELLDEVARGAMREAEAKGVSVTVRGSDEGMPRVWLDPQRISQALRYLVNNAVKYSPVEGEVALSGRIEMVPGRHGAAEEQLTLEVQDAGPGIAPEHVERVLDAFYSAPGPNGEPVGLGLGLTLAAAYTRAHGGELRLDKPAGAGLRVALCLPLGHAAEV